MGQIYLPLVAGHLQQPLEGWLQASRNFQGFDELQMQRSCRSQAPEAMGCLSLLCDYSLLFQFGGIYLYLDNMVC